MFELRVLTLDIPLHRVIVLDVSISSTHLFILGGTTVHVSDLVFVRKMRYLTNATARAMTATRPIPPAAVAPPITAADCFPVSIKTKRNSIVNKLA